MHALAIRRKGRPKIARDGRGRLVLLSFLMLFIELALIRWAGSNVIYLSYFSNFVLLGSFLGIGVGFLRGRARVDLFPWAGVVLAFLVAFVLLFPVTIDRSGAQLIYFGDFTRTGLPIWVTLPIIFVAVAVLMACVAQGVARSFATFQPLDAYRLDILGSIAGIVGFSILSLLGAPPVAWGLVVAATFIVLYRPSLRVVQVGALIAMVLMLTRESVQQGDSWSPYYKVSVFSVAPGVEALNVNGIPHQLVESTAHRRKTEPTYFLPYQRIQRNPLRNVLIVGAGNGGDVAIALAAGAKHVDAVEIDPRIYRIGRQLNPNHPYQDPRVTARIDDGRAFLERTRSRYDLILFALPDSLTLVSGQSSLRLESYLFTIQAIRAARDHLTPGGAFGMYNYYREPWLIDRLARTLQVAFAERPCLDSAGTMGRLALLSVGREPGDVHCGAIWSPEERSIPAPVTDDAPFLYLRTRAIPSLYLITLAMILLASLLLVRGTAGPLGPMSGYLDLFFMGAAFLLLETKNVVQFALLFGTTWFVNALVFVGILLSVYGAVEVARHVRLRHPARLYFVLFGALALAWGIQPDRLLPLSVPLRFGAAVGLAFAPIFIANLVFAERFRAVGSSTIAFGANLLGAMVGGVLEYSSLLLGYRNLLPLVAALYGLAFVLGRKHLRPRPDAGPMEQTRATESPASVLT
jgi:Spermine/spermidine synthase domain